MQKAKMVATIIFGVVFPLLILFQAYQGIETLVDDVSYRTTVNDLVGNLGDAKEKIENANDYALFSLLYVEHANQKTMINKQIMKSTIIHIGFAVISIGMMLIIFGIQGGGQGGVDAAVDVQGITFDFKTGSTGVAVFCVGAVMATIGGILKNEYQTSQIPSYETVISGTADPAIMQSIEAYKFCAAQSADRETCFMQTFYQINEGRLK